MTQHAGASRKAENVEARTRIQQTPHKWSVAPENDEHWPERPDAGAVARVPG